MGIPNIFALVQTTLYILVFILSFFICIPAGVNVDNFSGRCLLHASGTWSISTSHPSPQIIDIQWGPESACNFTIFIGVISLVISLFYSVWISVILARDIESSWLDAFLKLVVNSVMCICIFSDALTVSVGFGQWCELITDPKSKLEDCESGQYVNIFNDLTIDTNNYFTQWQVTQFGVWCSWICWLILSVMSLVRLYQYHRREAFTVSINREQQRLIQKVGQNAEQA